MAELRGDLQNYEKGGVKVTQEYFSSIHHMLACLDSRENNQAMYDQHSSTKRGNSGWAGTSSYGEAVKLLTCGYTDILGRLSLGIKKAMKSLQDYDFSKSSIVEDVQGAAPIVPNYLRGLPKTMSYRQPVSKKVKTINIVYAPTANCGTGAEEFIEAGIALLSAIRAIEKSNIAIKLDCMFKNSYEGREAVIGSVRIKNYRDRLDLQKLCFPIAHPSMLRRIGFKFLETVPGLTNRDFAGGYGRSPDMDELTNYLKLQDNTVLLNFYLVHNELDCDPKKIIEYINEKVQNR